MLSLIVKITFTIMCYYADQSLVTEVRTLRLNIRDFELKKLIGRGHYGEVQVVQEKKSGHIYALKIMRKSDVLSQQNVSKKINYYLGKYYISLLLVRRH